MPSGGNDIARPAGPWRRNRSALHGGPRRPPASRAGSVSARTSSANRSSSPLGSVDAPAQRPLPALPELLRAQVAARRRRLQSGEDAFPVRSARLVDLLGRIEVRRHEDLPRVERAETLDPRPLVDLPIRGLGELHAGRTSALPQQLGLPLEKAAVADRSESPPPNRPPQAPRRSRRSRATSSRRAWRSSRCGSARARSFHRGSRHSSERLRSARGARSRAGRWCRCRSPKDAR